MLRVVLDTNVLVSAVISDGKPRELLKKGIANQFSMVTSDLILRELVTVLRRPTFKTREDEAHRIILALIRSSEIVNIKSEFKVVKADRKDDMIINTAYDGHADLVVTGDKHLLQLESFREIKIITVEAALNLL
jgi:putative PIN family toxin of toxin-antitoxin system